MANTLAKGADAQRAYRTWLVSFLTASTLMATLGLALAGLENGAARPWSGVAFVVAMGLALVVGASKTSSA